MSEKLQHVREFEDKYVPHVAFPPRPDFHVTGGIGWINDPNGFSVYKGEYHLFYQYHPFATRWGPMHWGHVKTKDFIKWERLPVALAPDTEADKDGCFSGTALELKDGRHLLMYTGVRRERQEDGRILDYQEQCIAIGDGVDYEKYTGNPVLTGLDLPEGYYIYDFRDPKVWQETDGTYHAAICCRAADHSGAILMFESKELFHWERVGIIDECHNEYGRIWECPDFFPLDGKQMLIVSPQEMTPMGLEFHAGYGVIALMGTYDKETLQFNREKVQAVDYGIDFYAPETLLTPDGRRIMIAWMQNWTTSNCVTPDAQWFGAMTLPRELEIRDNRLIQNPVRELANYHGRRVFYQDVLVTREMNLYGVSGRVLDMTVTVRPILGGAMYRQFKINLAKDGEHAAVIRYKPETSTVRIDRTRCGGRFDIVHVRDFLVRPRNGEIKLRIILDHNSLELFVNDGEQAATMLLYVGAQAQSISFEAEGPALMDVEKYDLVFDQDK